MRQVKVTRQRNALIVTHKLGKNEQISRMELDIVRKGDIDALLCAEIQTGFMGVSLCFHIQNKINILHYLRSKISFGNFANAVLQIVTTVRQCHSYGIRTGNVELNPNLVFLDSAVQKVQLLYWPIISLEEETNELKFFKALGMCYASAPEEQNYQAEYLSYFSNRARFELVQFEQMMMALYERWRKEHSAEAAPQMRTTKPRVDVTGATTGQEKKKSFPVLQRLLTNQIFEVTHTPFYVGRGTDCCSLALLGDSFISRIHLKIVEKNGKMYLFDYHSHNGTIVDDKKIPPEVAVELHSGSVIKLGHEQLVYYAAGEY